MKNWKVNSWRKYPVKHVPKYDDEKELNNVLNKLKNNQPTNSEENLKSEKEKYFQFRDVLLSKSNLTIDSSMVKNFIL